MNRVVTLTMMALGAAVMAACADPVAADPIEPVLDLQQSPVDQGRYSVTLSQFDHDTTLNRLLQAIDRRDLTVFATVDHQAGAAAFDLEMPAATVVIFGAAQLGTPLMVTEPMMAAELPLRAAVYDDAEGVTHLAVSSPASIGRAFPVVAAEQAPRLEAITRNLTALSEEVTGNGS